MTAHVAGTDGGLRRVASDLAGLSPRHWFIIAVAATLQAIDGFDLYTVAFAGSSIAKALHLSPSRLGVAFAGAQFGSLFGATAIAFAVTRVSRKPLLLVIPAVVGLSSLATMTASSFGMLLACRIVTGVGLGAALPLVVGYAAEFSPPRVRASVAAIVVAAMQLGAMVAGLVAAALIPRFGWHSIFVVGGVVPLALLAAIAALPPALTDLVRKGAPQAQIDALCQDYGLSLSEPLEPAPAPGGDGRAPVDRSHRLALAAVLASSVFGSLIGFLLSTWMPTLLETGGLSQQWAALCGSFIGAGGIVGTLALGRLMDRTSPYRVAAGGYFAAVLVFAALVVAPPSPALILGLCFLAGACAVGAVLANFPFTNLVFPVAMRIGVMAWITGLSRFAGLVAPASAGFILDHGGTPQTLFLIAGGLALSAAAVMLTSGSLPGARR